MAKEVEQQKDQIFEVDFIKPLHNVFLDFNQSSVHRKLIIKSNEGVIVISRNDGLVFSSYADEKLTYEALNSNESQQVKFKEELGDMTFKTQIQLDEFYWNVGFGIENVMIAATDNDMQPKFKLISWPNYGELVFKKEFIYLSSLVWKSSEAYGALVELSECKESIVNQFLNATLLTGHVVMFEYDELSSEIKHKKPNIFLIGLKKIFGFN